VREGSRRTLPPRCRRGLALAKALVSPQLEELRPALAQPGSAQSMESVGLGPCSVPGRGSSPGTVADPPGLSALGSGGEASACLSPTLLISINFGPF